jgi:hypothetical protein
MIWSFYQQCYLVSESYGESTYRSLILFSSDQNDGQMHTCLHGDTIQVVRQLALGLGPSFDARMI